MARINYTRAEKREAIWGSEIASRESKLDPNWLPVVFGKFIKKPVHIAELLLTAPSYFFWAYSSGAFKRFNPWLEYQAFVLIQKATHIRPWRYRPDNWAFDLSFNDNGRLVKFRTVKKSSPAKPGWMRVKHLDLTLVTSPYHAGDRIYRRLLKRIHAEFFGEQNMRYWDYQEFFETEAYFDTCCREFHCPRIERKFPVWKDRANRRYPLSHTVQ